MGPGISDESSSLGAWSYELRRVDVRGTLESLGLDASPVSPLAALRQGGDVAPGVSGTVRQDDPAWAVGLRVLAHPERVLVYEHQHGNGRELLTFLVGSGAIVQVAVLVDRVCFSRPMSAKVLASALVQVAEPAATSNTGSHEIPMSVIRVLSVLLESGLSAGTRVSIPAAQARALLEGVPALPCDPEAALAALVSDGVLMLDEAGYSLSPAWLVEFAYLRDAGWLQLSSAELIDVADGYLAWRQLAVVGADGRQRAVLKGERWNQRHRLLFAPLTREVLSAGVVALCGPPRLRQAPSVDQPEPPGMLRGQVDIAASSWLVSSVDELQQAAGQEGAAAWAAILRPEWRARIASGGPAAGAVHHSKIGVAGSSAVQWEMRGSRIAWRTLGGTPLRNALRDLLPMAREISPDDLPPLAWVSVRQLGALLTGVGSEARRGLPEALRSFESSEAKWCVVSTGSQNVGEPRELCIGCDGSGILWRFDQAADRITCVPIAGVDEPSDLWLDSLASA